MDASPFSSPPLVASTFFDMLFNIRPFFFCDMMPPPLFPFPLPRFSRMMKPTTGSSIVVAVCLSFSFLPADVTRARVLPPPFFPLFPLGNETGIAFSALRGSQMMPPSPPFPPCSGPVKKAPFPLFFPPFSQAGRKEITHGKEVVCYRHKPDPFPSSHDKKEIPTFPFIAHPPVKGLPG